MSPLVGFGYQTTEFFHHFSLNYLSLGLRCQKFAEFPTSINFILNANIVSTKLINSILLVRIVSLTNRSTAGNLARALGPPLFKYSFDVDDHGSASNWHHLLHTITVFLIVHCHVLNNHCDMMVRGRHEIISFLCIRELLSRLLLKRAAQDVPVEALARLGSAFFVVKDQAAWDASFITDVATKVGAEGLNNSIFYRWRFLRIDLLLKKILHAQRILI